MESNNFLFRYEDLIFPIQIIRLQESYFVFVGRKDLNFDNLTVSNMMPGEGSPNCFTIIDDEYSEVGKSLANKLGNFCFKYSDEV